MLLGSIITLALIGCLAYFIHNKANRRHSYHGHDSHKLKGSHHKQNHQKQPATQHSNFHCVETHHHSQCCQAVKELHGKRFLSAEAPILPVQGCDQANCACDYIHHEDRRVEVRRTDIGIQHDMYGQNGEAEHRNDSHHGRRNTD